MSRAIRVRGAWPALVALALAACAPAAVTPSGGAAAGSPPDIAAPAGTGWATLEAVTPDIGAPAMGPVVVGARSYVESRLVAEVYAQALEGAGFDVERQFTFASSAEANSALVAGAIDLYPERPRVAAEEVLGFAPTPVGDVLLPTVRDAYTLFDVVWLAPAPYRPADPMTPVVRRAALDLFPGLAPVLDAASALLTEADMDLLTARVERDRREPRDVVREFLAARATPAP